MSDNVIDARYVGGAKVNTYISVPTGQVDSEGASGSITIYLPQNFDVPSQAGVYSGSLSSLGNMVAMQLNTEGYLFYDAISGELADPTKTNFGFSLRQNIDIQVKPYLLGYFRQYWKNPAGSTFGADSPIPALTGVMPATSEFADVQGNFLFYVDQQMCRLTGGGGGFNFDYFYSAFSQLLGWVDTSNKYILALKQIEQRNLEYYGFKNYNDYVTQGLTKYQTGQALRKCLSNIGKLTQTIGQGYFGTPGAVAKSLIDNNLGYIGDLSQKLYLSGVVYDDIYNPDYNIYITNILQSITDPADLEVIQDTLESKCVILRSLMDYTSLEAASGLQNDSEFANLEEVGKDLYLKFPNAEFVDGNSLVRLINDIEGISGSSVESVAGTDTLLSPSIIESFKNFLPLAQGDDPITVMNVIGTPSGYLNDYMQKVVQGIDELAKTSYGQQIANALMEISRTGAGIALNSAEQRAFERYVPVPPPVYSSDESGTSLVSAGGPGYWVVQCNQKKQAYYDLLNTVVADKSGNIPAIIEKINNNYLEACRLLQTEIKNYAKANIRVEPFAFNGQIFSFVENLSGLAVDSGNIGTAYMLYNMAQDNDAGNLLKTVIVQARNEQSLVDAGVKLNGPV